MNIKEEIASEMHRWGRMTGAFSIIVMVTWVALGTATTTGFLAARSSLLWPGVVLAILAVIGLFGGFGLDYLAGVVYHSSWQTPLSGVRGTRMEYAPRLRRREPCRSPVICWPGSRVPAPRHFTG